MKLNVFFEGNVHRTFDDYKGKFPINNNSIIKQTGYRNYLTTISCSESFKQSIQDTIL